MMLPGLRIMTKQRLAEYGMWSFIAAVIIAGLFGPWVMSLLLGLLTALCIQSRWHGEERGF
ncbi:hypothetical protein SAMN05444161_0514 [Rhizobiales bacterium GAS191]|jgi:hypothetical protein|nr:hypothetical protein SAMN05444161_0514 [Rhizobiales bacterium GAS191]SED09777.1 hypothetical protein SAMN05519104_2788 [Rhizobiales bacterium GAS188]